MNKDTRIKGIIFDMDGVLIDAKDWHYEALNRALAVFGIEISRHEHLSTYDGLSTRQKLNMLSKVYSLPTALHDFINELKQQYTMDITHQRCKPTFNHQYTLSKLKNEGYGLAVASNAVSNTVKVMMEKARLSNYFDILLSNQDVAKAKPDPEIYHTAISQLDLTPDECVIIEDNHNGLIAARKSGAHVLKVDNVNDVTYSNVKNFIQELSTNA